MLNASTVSMEVKRSDFHFCKKKYSSVCAAETNLIWFNFYSYPWGRLCSILAMLEKSVLPLGWNSSHATLKRDVRTLNFKWTSLLHHHEKHRMMFGKRRYAKYNVKNKRNDEWWIITFNGMVEKIIKHRSLMQTDKSRPEGKRIMPETR